MENKVLRCARQLSPRLTLEPRQLEKCQLLKCCTNFDEKFWDLLHIGIYYKFHKKQRISVKCHCSKNEDFFFLVAACQYSHFFLFYELLRDQ